MASSCSSRAFSASSLAIHSACGSRRLRARAAASATRSPTPWARRPAMMWLECNPPAQQGALLTVAGGVIGRTRTFSLYFAVNLRRRARLSVLVDALRERGHRALVDVTTDEAAAELAPLVVVRVACEAVGASQAGYYRRHRASPGPARPRRSRTVICPSRGRSAAPSGRPFSPRVGQASESHATWPTTPTLPQPRPAATTLAGGSFCLLVSHSAVVARGPSGRMRTSQHRQLSRRWLRPRR